MRSESIWSKTAAGASLLGMVLIPTQAAAQAPAPPPPAPTVEAPAPAGEVPAPAPEPATQPPGDTNPAEPVAEPASPAPHSGPSPAPVEPAVDTTDPASAPPRLQLVAQPDADPPPPGPRTMRRHDGFYLRTSFGFGLLWGDFDLAVPGEPNLKASGSAIGFDLLVGGSPSPGFSIGGGFMGSWLLSADFDQNGDPAEEHTLGSGLIGVFVDGFPQDTGGWHLGGLVGLAGQTLSNNGEDEETGGFGGALWGGYDQWVAPDFSVGGQIKFMAIRTTGSDSDVRAGSATLNFMLTALYH